MNILRQDHCHKNKALLRCRVKNQWHNAKQNYTSSKQRYRLGTICNAPCSNRQMKPEKYQIISLNKRCVAMYDNTNSVWCPLFVVQKQLNILQSTTSARTGHLIWNHASCVWCPLFVVQKQCNILQSTTYRTFNTDLSSSIKKKSTSSAGIACSISSQDM